MATMSPQMAVEQILRIYQAEGLVAPSGPKLSLLVNKVVANSKYLQTIKKNPQNYIGAQGIPNRGVLTLPEQNYQKADAAAAESPEAAEARIKAIYAGLPGNIDPPGPAKMARMVQNVMSRGWTYFDTIRRDPLRYLPASQGGSLPDPETADGNNANSEDLAGLNAEAILKKKLADYGLDFSDAEVARWVGMISDDPANIALVESEIRDHETFKNRFPGLQSRLDAGYNAISVEEYLELEDSYRTIFRNAGMPRHYYDEVGELAEFISNDVSPQELEARVTEGYLAAKNAPQEVKDALQQFYGIQNSDGALAAYYLDPDKALDAIQREYESAVIAGTANQVRYRSGITQGQAEELQAIGVTDREAREGFSTLEQSQELMSGGVGEVGASTLTQQNQLDAQFKRDAEMLDRIRRQRERRLAGFQGADAGAVVSNQGFVGLRAANA